MSKVIENLPGKCVLPLSTDPVIARGFPQSLLLNKTH